MRDVLQGVGTKNRALAVAKQFLSWRLTGWTMHQTPRCLVSPVGIRGYTLIELLITLLVLSILAGAAWPSWQRQLSRRAVESQVAEFRSAIQQARREALQRGEVVSLCARDPALGATPARCMRSGRDWSGGWLMFVDRDSRGDMSANDLLIKVHQAGPQDGPVLGTVRSLSFEASGISLTSASHVRFLPLGSARVDAAIDGSQMVCINKPGRARVTAEAECAS